MAEPACSPVRSNATATFAASSVKPCSSARGTLACPAAAMIAASPSAATGIRVDISRTDLPIAWNASGVGKSTTLRTSAMADSKRTAAPTAPIKGRATA